MYDRNLIRSMLIRTDEAIEKILYRAAEAESAGYFTGLPESAGRR